jgi:hypothetical protein
MKAFQWRIQLSLWLVILLILASTADAAAHSPTFNPAAAPPLVLLAGLTALVLAAATCATRFSTARSAPLRAFGTLPRAVQVGLLILAIGGLVDVLFHLTPPLWATRMGGVLGHDGHSAHLIMLVGMAVTLLGVVMRRSPPIPRRDERPAQKGGAQPES